MGETGRKFPLNNAVEVVEVDERAGNTWGDLDAEFVWSAVNPTEDESTSNSTVDSSGRTRTRCADRCIKYG